MGDAVEILLNSESGFLATNPMENLVRRTEILACLLSALHYCSVTSTKIGSSVKVMGEPSVA